MLFIHRGHFPKYTHDSQSSKPFCFRLTFSLFLPLGLFARKTDKNLDCWQLSVLSRIYGAWLTPSFALHLSFLAVSAEPGVIVWVLHGEF